MQVRSEVLGFGWCIAAMPAGPCCTAHNNALNGALFRAINGLYITAVRIAHAVIGAINPH
jgi:hypothetical protein